MSWLRRSTLPGVVCFALVAFAWLGFSDDPLQGQQPGKADLKALEAKWNSIRWQNGPCVAKIGSLAEVKVPKGCKYADRQGLLVLLDLTMNPASPRDLGVVCPQDYHVLYNGSWFLTFEWDSVGYVKDEDKNNLDGNALLTNLQKAQDGGNKDRSARGWPTLRLEGWAKAPFYDPETNLLTWATRISASDMPQAITVNYNSRILGREGVMSANLVVDEKLLDKELPMYREVVKGFSYLQGKRYSEWKSGDKVATLGLTALIAGGAAAVAAQGGLLGKLGKGLIYIVVAIGAGIVSLFKKLFGGGRQSAEEDQSQPPVS